MNDIITIENIQNKIHAVRGKRVMLDSDLASLYDVEVKRLNEQVKRNIHRFPERFMFQLTEDEYNDIRSQFATLGSNLSQGEHKKYLPYVFTEQGVSMLSAVLRSKVAVYISIQIIDAFVNMRKFIQNNATLFYRLDNVEKKQLATDEKLDMVLKSIESNEVRPKQNIFYEGKIFDAYVFVNDIIKTAKKTIKIIDNYVDESVLVLLSKCDLNIKITVYTKTISDQLRLDVKKYSSQYSKIEIKKLNLSHDRFIIIDDKDIYHIGASLKDIGKKWFAVSKMDIDSLEMIKKLDVAK